MWYPSQQQQQQHSCHGYTRHHPSQQQQQQTYPRTAYYCNTDELSATCVNAINDENDSPMHCQTTYSSNVHATTPNYYVTTSVNPYGDEMSSYQTTPTRKTCWNPAIIAPTKTLNMTTPSLPVVSPPSSSTTTTTAAACWDWLLFSPQYYSEIYTPSSTFVPQQKIEEEDDDKDDGLGLNFLASLPTCLLALLYLTPKLIRTSHDENDSDQEIGSLHTVDESLASSLPIHTIVKNMNTISSNLSLSSNTKSNPTLHGQQIKQNRSSTPDSDDGYQSASDASRSDCSQQSSLPYDHHNSRDDITLTEHSLPIPLMPRRISYAAAVKPIAATTTTTTTKLSSLSSMISKPKQTINNTLSTITSTNDISNGNGQKLKFIAPRFERMHHAKQYSSSSSSSSSTSTAARNSPSTSSNRTQVRSSNTNQRNHLINSTRRR